jgi:pimeloyl-ACP methyl ester carboxylesterase
MMMQTNAAGSAAGRGPRWVVGMPTAAALILLSAVCRGDRIESRKPSYISAPCPNPIFTDIVLGHEFTCGYLNVPENRTRPDSRTIRLAVATRKAAAPNPKPDPIVFLTGGPGGSGLAEGPGVTKAWHRDRDVIFVDTRGALKAHPFLSCPEIDSFYIDTISLSWSAPETAQQDALATRTCRDRLAAAGADLASYNSSESSADIADLRIAMGIDQWNLYGVSAGADLALQVLRDHPAGVRSLVLDAVLPPQLNPIESGWRAANESVTAIYDACAAQPACKAAFPEGRAEYTQVVNDLVGNPRIVHVADPTTGKRTTVVIDAYKLTYTVAFGTLIGSPHKIPLIIHDLAVGAGAQAALEVIADRFPPDFNSYGVQWGILCREMVSRTDPASVAAAGRRDFPELSASVTAMPAMFTWAFRDCAEWDVPPAPSQVAMPVTSDVPVLLTSGAFDATLPPSYAAEAAKTLKNSTNLVFPGIGHSASRWSPTCFATVMANFLDQPSGFDYSCVAALTVPKFDTP